MEALRRDPKMNSTVLHLLIDAWPAGWIKSVMDCDRQAKPAYFTFRDALTPLAVNLHAPRFHLTSGEKLRLGAWVCNDTVQVPEGTRLHYQVELAGVVIQKGGQSSAPGSQ
jgi:hypothetical protein